MKKYILPVLIISSLLFGEYYSDRFLVYIDNSQTNFMLDNSSNRTNNKLLNQKLDEYEVFDIHQWLFWRTRNRHACACMADSADSQHQK